MPMELREGHVELVEYILEQGAYDPSYKTYPFLDSLLTIAEDRGHTEIARLLRQYEGNPTRVKFKGDNGRIVRERTAPAKELEQSADKGEIDKAGASWSTPLAWARKKGYRNIESMLL